MAEREDYTRQRQDHQEAQELLQTVISKIKSPRMVKTAEALRSMILTDKRLTRAVRTQMLDGLTDLLLTIHGK